MNKFDSLIFDFFNFAAQKFWLADWAGIFFAKYLPYILAAVVLYFIFRERGRKRIYFFALASLSAILSRGIIVETIRFFYKRERPFSALDFTPLVSADAFDSFPSGHTAFFFALAMAVFFINKKAGAWLFGFSALVAVSRIFVGIHWPLDILVGVIIGVLSAFGVKKALSKTEN
jgi:undecaprenyl-diphosphatase